VVAFSSAPRASRHVITRRGLLAGLLLVVAALLVPGQGAHAAELRGHVVAVGDGDSITVLTDQRQRLRVRLAEIDAPERRQAFGDRARQILSQLVFERRVVLRVTGTDRNRRVIAKAVQLAQPPFDQVELGRDGPEVVQRGSALRATLEVEAAKPAERQPG
jgi:endonuclease YncB( thermonuclease family)